MIGLFVEEWTYNYDTEEGKHNLWIVIEKSPDGSLICCNIAGTVQCIAFRDGAFVLADKRTSPAVHFSQSFTTLETLILTNYKSDAFYMSQFCVLPKGFRKAARKLFESM